MPKEEDHKRLNYRGKEVRGKKEAKTEKRVKE